MFFTSSIQSVSLKEQSKIKIFKYLTYLLEQLTCINIDKLLPWSETIPASFKLHKYENPLLKSDNFGRGVVFLSTFIGIEVYDNKRL